MKEKGQECVLVAAELPLEKGWSDSHVPSMELPKEVQKLVLECLATSAL